MTESPLRSVELWNPDVDWERRNDGSILVWQNGKLGDYPARLSDRIKHWAKERPDTPWMAERDAAGVWQRVTFAQLLTHIRSIGQALLDMGLSTDRPLVILSGNSTQHALIALGAQYAGIPSAAIAPAYSLVAGEFGKLDAVRDQITPGAVFVQDTGPFGRAIEAVFADLPVLGVSGDGLAMSWDALLATPATAAVDKANAATGPDTIAKFLFTSGTTGSPKAVIQTQRMMCVNMEQMTDCYAYLRTEPPVILDWSPWNHVAGGNLCFNTAIYNGGTFHIDGGRPTRDMMANTIRDIREIKPNWYWNVPFGYEMLVEAMDADPSLADAFFKNLKLKYYAGAAMAQHTWDALERLAEKSTGERVLLATGLGSTETAPFALFNTDPEAPAGCIGVPAKEIILKLVPVEGKWEARVKGPNVTPGYWRNEKLTAEAFDEEGFYCLGDALKFVDESDPSKGFFFDGRVAENFKLSTGTWVGVGALRAKLTDALGGLMRDAVIVGEGEDYLGALLVPFRPAIEKLVPGGEGMSDAELCRHPVLTEALAEKLAAYNATATGSSLRVPRVIVMDEALNMDRGEVTDKGSVNQRAVRANRAELVADIYAGSKRVILGKKG
ncbi:feruloyl-CoA synthase [Pararhodobacter zhoushanensis]|uniref:Feruloyl-CoA synthase n=1 Tax=Pararhodobacter zhoushanensis TaxID=2479545 RepID=A0ABT3GZD6_9RHOB|nr:feruloyl-CoA synthase [Pararhodobacter zhoushanensis]MCW1932845.1 feruloyl-CoA synthase [Pararhodobacter zhoushanensis]